MTNTSNKNLHFLSYDKLNDNFLNSKRINFKENKLLISNNNIFKSDSCLFRVSNQLLVWA